METDDKAASPDRPEQCAICHQVAHRVWHLRGRPRRSSATLDAFGQTAPSEAPASLRLMLCTVCAARLERIRRTNDRMPLRLVGGILILLLWPLLRWLHGEGALTTLVAVLGLGLVTWGTVALARRERRLRGVLEGLTRRAVLPDWQDLDWHLGPLAPDPTPDPEPEPGSGPSRPS